MKITQKQLRRLIKEERTLLSEMNPNGTISDDEDQARDDLMAAVEIQVDELVQYIEEQAWKIGGDFRGPGIRYQALKILNKRVQRRSL